MGNELKPDKIEPMDNILFLRKRIAELEAEVNRLRDEVEHAYAEAWVDAGGEPDEGPKCWDISDAKQAIKDVE